jgi:two-component system sensor histidine kinase QseC
VGTLIGTACVLVPAGVVLSLIAERALWNVFDESLATRARSLAAMAEVDDGEIELEFAEVHLPEFEPSGRPAYYQVWLDDGRVYARSPSLGQHDLDRVQGSWDAPAFQSTTLPDGRPGRLAGIRFAPRQENGRRAGSAVSHYVTLVFGCETAVIDQAVAMLRTLLIAVGALTLGLTAFVLAAVVRRGLKPVDALAAQIASVRPDDLSARIEPAGVPAELLPVVERLNDLLARLEQAFHRERRFSADVAHELRTPLAGIRTLLEVSLAQPRDAASSRHTMEECLDINRRMQQMVENLLHLARADARQIEIATEPVNLSQLVRDCWRPFEEPAAAKRLHTEWRLDAPCTIETDRDKLRLILGNILGNAVSYTNDGGNIEVELTTDAPGEQEGTPGDHWGGSDDFQTRERALQAPTNGQHIELTVTNTGSTINPADADRVFDRFWRGDTARRATGEHAGLGLSLCRMLVEALGGSIRATATPDGRFRIAMTFTEKPA